MPAANNKGSRLAFFYEGGGRSKTISQLLHCIRFSPGIVLLTGVTGSGRSLILATVSRTLSAEEADFCLLADDTAVLETEEDLYHALSNGFGLKPKAHESLDDLASRVQRFIAVGLQQKRSVVVAIDDVRQHGLDVLEALLLLAGSNKGICMILAGEPNLIETLKQFHTQSLLIHQVAIRPLLPEEVADFTRQYLALQNVPDSQLPKRKDLEAIMAKTGGNLTLLIRELDQWLLGFQSQRTKPDSARFPWLHVLAIVLVLAGIAVTYILYPGETVPVSVTQRESLDIVESVPPKHSVDIPIVEELSPDSQETVVTQDLTPPSLPAVMPTVLEEESEKEPKPEEVTAVTPGIQAAAKESEKEAVKKLEVEGYESTQTRGPTAAEKSATGDLARLLEASPKEYSLQLANLGSEKAVQQFLEGQPQEDQRQLMHYVRTRKGKKSYIVLYGLYPNKQAALMAQKSLNKHLSAAAPWPRQLQEIQQELAP